METVKTFIIGLITVLIVIAFISQPYFLGSLLTKDKTPDVWFVGIFVEIVLFFIINFIYFIGKKMRAG